MQTVVYKEETYFWIGWRKHWIKHVSSVTKLIVSTLHQFVPVWQWTYSCKSRQKWNLISSNNAGRSWNESSELRNKATFTEYFQPSLLLRHPQMFISELLSQKKAAAKYFNSLDILELFAAVLCCFICTRLQMAPCGCKVHPHKGHLQN